ncbi:hypothetical protein LPJ55_004573 [Coemansia sp. RSA 990]|nr:hypothetical protein LPJ55_004573 [Coemansia sp. RSA 990]
MFSLVKSISAAAAAVRPSVLGVGSEALWARTYSQRNKTGGLKCKEKRRRLRQNKPDGPAQAKRGVRVSKL